MNYKYYFVNSDNVEECYITAEDYKDLTLTMSSGDFGAHSAVGMNKLPKGAKLTELDFSVDDSICQTCGTEYHK